MTMLSSRLSLLLVTGAMLALLTWFDKWSLRATGEGRPTAAIPVDAASRPNVGAAQPSLPAVPLTPELAGEAATHINPLASIKREALRATLARPLFSPSRTPFRPPVKIARTPPSSALASPRRAVVPPQPNSFVVVGIMSAATGRVAVLHDKQSARNTAVRHGDRFGAWRVVAIDDRTVKLQQGGNSVTLRVFPKQGG